MAPPVTARRRRRGVEAVGTDGSTLTSGNRNRAQRNGEVRPRTSPAEVMFGYAVLVMLVGAAAFDAANYQPRAISSLYAGNFCAMCSLVCATLVTKHGQLEKGDEGWRSYIIAMHAGLLVPVVYGIASGVRLAKIIGVPEKAYVIPFLAVNIFLSVACFALLLQMRLKKDTAELKPNPLPRETSGKATKSGAGKNKSS